MSRYASETTVTPEKSRMEIETLLRRYGADQFAYGWSPSGAQVGFRYAGRMIRFDLPPPDSKEVLLTPSGRPRKQAAAEKALEQAERQRWRALALVIKAKLEAVESGITTFEAEFLAHTVLPDGSTVGSWAEAQLGPAIQAGRMPRALLEAGGPS